MSTNENVGVALALVVAAGASTALGAAVVFFPSIVKLASRRVLAGSLGFSGGVMTYVSFVEIFFKSMTSFQAAGHNARRAYSYATICFFAGVVIMMALNALVAYLLGGSTGPGGNARGQARKGKKKSTVKRQKTQSTQSNSDASKPNDGLAKLPCCNRDPVNQLEKIHNMAEELDSGANGSGNIDMDMDMDVDMDIEDDFVDNLPLEDDQEKNENLETEEEDDLDDPTSEEEKRRLVSMGINTAVAIGLHNFPEGLATFVAALDDPRVGAVLAFAIAIHNIPEGLCVALPIYYATGNRLNAFFWALLSGASEFFAALLGWAVLANSFSDNLYAALFGLVAGMMVIISVRELLPTAHFYDPEDTCVTHTFIAGMVLIAASLVLFTLYNATFTFDK